MKNGQNEDKNSHTGYSLKKRALLSWLKENGYTTTYFAAKLGLTKKELNRRLWLHIEFNRKEIHEMIILMKARAAFKVIYFPLLSEKRSVYKQVFGLA